MFGIGSSLGPVPCYFLAEVTAVDVETHVCSIQMLRGLEIYDNIKLFRDPGNLNLPTVGDLCAVIWDNRNVPIIIGFYPVHHRTKLEEFSNYQVEEGEVITQSRFGQKLLMNQRGEIFLTNWGSQGLEIYEKEGLVLCRSDSYDGVFSSVEKRSGVTKRYSQVAFKDANVASIDDLTTATTGLGIRTLVEDATIITEPDLLATPIYEHKVGNLVVSEDTLLPTDIKNLAINSDSSLPLRSQTKYFASDGVSYLEVAVDILGNVKIDIPATAITSGVNIEGLLSDLNITFKNVTIGDAATTIENNINALTINVTGTTAVNVNAPIVNIGTDDTTTEVNLGSNLAKVLCNNLPACLFTGTSHVSGNTIVKV